MNAHDIKGRARTSPINPRHEQLMAIIADNSSADAVEAATFDLLREQPPVNMATFVYFLLKDFQPL
jgi:hypothetical protein